jgi:HSP20 family molecular chaperone IbpA
MQAMEQSAGNTAEIVRTTSPMEFFSMVHHIESCLCGKTLEILSARNWEGSLTPQDWEVAERIVLDPVAISSTVRNDSVVLRVPVCGYGAEDIRLHTEGDLLCLCGYTTREQELPRMFYTRFKLPASLRGCRTAAWISDAVLHVVLSREQVSSAQPNVAAPIVPESATTSYAAAV